MAKPSVSSSDSDAEWSRLEKLLDDRIWNDGRELTKAEIFRLLRFQYPRLHEVMFRSTRTARHRAWEKRYRAARDEWRSRS